MAQDPNRLLDDWRKKIDAIDLDLVRLLNERAQCAQEIGKIKKKLGLPAYSPDREEEIMRNVTSQSHGPLSLQALRRLFERIIDESRSLERRAIEGKSDE
ncbi:MAG TPA: chorismate mutase [Bacteroidota bacterium]|nr:chorismate mutase [Bacteroidota bacterium]